MLHLQDMGTAFFDLSMPTLSFSRKGKDVTPATFKDLDRLCKQIVLEPEVKKSFFRVLTYVEEERLRDMHRLIGKAMSYFHVRDELYGKVLSILRDKQHKLSEEQRLWGWRLLCVMLRYMVPSRTMLASLNVEGLVGCKEHVAYVQRHIKLARHAPPTYLMPTAEEVKFVCFRGAFVRPVFGVHLREIDDSLLVERGAVKLPKILIKLCEAILRWNGCSTEGLFRIPSDLRSFEDLKHSLEKGEYDILDAEKGDTIAVANLLKSWLRTLDDPLIPSQFYSKITEEHSPPASILKDLPEENLNALRCVLTLLQTISTPTNQGGTRMSVDALAVIFAPNLIRARAIEEGARGMEWSRRMSEYIKAEQEFVSQLIRQVK